jgi:hypothetical protein
MGRIYRVDDGPGLRQRQRALPKGTVAEVWADVFEPGTFWISEATKQRLEEVGGPLHAGTIVPASRIPIFYPDEPRDLGSLPAEESLRVRVLAGHGIAVTWYGTTAYLATRPLPEPTTPEDAFFYLMRMGGRTNHVWRLFRTRDEAVEFMARTFPQDARARAWAESLPVARYQDLLRGDAALGADRTGSPG